MNFVLEIRAFTKQETIIKADEFRLESTGWIPQEFSRLPQQAITRIRPRLSPLVALFWPAEPFSLARVRKRKKARLLSRSCDDRLVGLRRYVTLFQPFIFRPFSHVSLLPPSSPPSVSLSPFHHFFLLYFLRSVHFPANRELDDEHARAHVHVRVKAIPFSCNYTWNSCFPMHEADVCLARDYSASSTSSFYFCYADAQLILLSRFWSNSILSLEGKSRLRRGKSMRQLWLWPTPSMADYNKLCRWID